jgi:hypothetical protein
MMNNINNALSNREIKIKTGRCESIIDILRVLSTRLTRPENDQHPIESCVQARQLTYIKFSSAAHASRAIEELTKYKYHVNYSSSYLYLCLECDEDETTVNVRSQQEPTPSTSGQQESKSKKDKESELLRLNVSNNPISKGHNSIIKIGSVKASEFFKKFKLSDQIYFTLTDAKSNPEDDVLVLNEDVELPEET